MDSLSIHFGVSFSAHEDQSVIFSTWNAVGSCYKNEIMESVELATLTSHGMAVPC